MALRTKTSDCRTTSVQMAAALVICVSIVLTGCERNGDQSRDDAKPASKTDARLDEIETKIRELAKKTDDPAALIKYCEELYKDPEPRVTESAAALMINFNVGRLQQGEKDATAHLKRAVNVLLDRDSVGPLHLALSQKAAGWIERDNQIELANSIWKKIEQKFARHDDPDVAKQARDVVDRAKRRTGMIGSQLELAGPLVRGGELDWSKYRGKVVLVDFWATWCPPCVAEMPHLKKLYDKYHAQGFEILGVSLDANVRRGNRSALAIDMIRQFFNDRDLPWDSVYFPDEKDQRFNNPLTRKYGIGGLPQGVLVDRDGKVIAYNALGEVLDALLEEEFEAEAAK